MRKVLRMMNSIFGYCAAGVLGFFIGALVLISIMFVGGFHRPDRPIPWWLSILEWPIIIVPSAIGMLLRYLLLRVSEENSE
jgi:hypothetical protein